MKLTVVQNLLAFLAVPFTWVAKISDWLVSRLFAPIFGVWARMSKFWRNLFVGFVIALLLHFTHHMSFVSQTENLAMDTMMFVNQGTTRMNRVVDGNDPLQFTFFDIDEDTYRAWDEPFHIPRDKLFKLIETAVKNHAKAIVVDVDLSRASDNDSGLLEYLDQYQDNYPPLFLLRSFYPKSTYTDGENYQIRPSILDTIEQGKNIHWVQPLFKLSTYDQTIRYWHLLKIGCLNDQPRVIPSFQLLLDAYLIGADELKTVKSQLENLSPVKCLDIERVTKELTGSLVYGEKHIELDYDAHERLGERIIYTLQWTGEQTEELKHRSAYKLTKKKTAITDRIVIIGASFNDSRDIHQTPIGEMPGALVILNAIKSLHQFGQIKPPSLVIKLLLELILIVMMAWAFTHSSSLRGVIISGGMIMIILVPVSFYFFKYGLWVDFAVPLLGMQFHQTVVDHVKNIATRKHLVNLPDNQEK